MIDRKWAEWTKKEEALEHDLINVELCKAAEKLGKALERFSEFDGSKGEYLASVLVDMYGSAFVLEELVFALRRRGYVHPDENSLPQV